MPPPIHHAAEPRSNAARDTLTTIEPRALRTFTPTQAVLARSAGVYHWTPDGKRLYDFTSGVLVSNLGHNPTRWMERFADCMGWPAGKAARQEDDAPAGFFSAVAMTAYNAVTPIEVEATRRLLA